MRNAGFGFFRFRSPLLTESRLLSLPPGTEMVHFPGFARTRLWIQRAVSEVYSEGFPHSEIPGSKGASPSPRLIAGSRSEEHTSELQSQSNLVCRLLLEKKKT